MPTKANINLGYSNGDSNRKENSNKFTYYLSGVTFTIRLEVGTPEPMRHAWLATSVQACNIEALSDESQTQTLNAKAQTLNPKPKTPSPDQKPLH